MPVCCSRSCSQPASQPAGASHCRKKQELATAVRGQSGKLAAEECMAWEQQPTPGWQERVGTYVQPEPLKLTAAAGEEKGEKEGEKRGEKEGEKRGEKEGGKEKKKRREEKGGREGGREGNRKVLSKKF